MKPFIPSEYQPRLDPSRHIIQTEEAPQSGSLDLDVLFVGAGPASLAAAIKLADLARERKPAGKSEVSIGIMEKADQIGGHTLSGAAVSPIALQWLFPEKKISDFPLRKKITKESFRFLTKNSSIPLPVPPGMSSRGCWTASLCEIVRWLGSEAEKRGIHVFTSFPAEKLLMRGDRAAGAASKPFGLNKDGSKEPGFEPASKIFAKAVVLSEGSRGHLTQAWLAKEGIGRGAYPQTYALGVKELWEAPSEPKGILHTLGWPLGREAFGGSWMYPLGNHLISLGLVAGLDSPSAGLSVHDKLQEMKRHPLFASLLKGGKCLEWGAKTIPEGGWKALPARLHGHGLLIIGDSAGFVNMLSLKGVHYAMASGILAAETLAEALEKNDFSKAALSGYDKKIKNSFIKKELWASRNLRHSFQKGFFSGMFRAGVISLTGGRWPRDFPPGRLKPDAEAAKAFSPRPDPEPDRGGQTLPARLSKADAVYLSGSKTRDKIPSHLRFGPEAGGQGVSKLRGRFYERMCPAGVYEQRESLAVSPSNCIDCKATDILGPRWSPRERGSGPSYRLM